MRGVTLGLTGTIAAGKSTVSALLAAEGFTVIDVDKVGHKLLQKPRIMDMLVTEFGEDVIVDRAIDRRVLGHKAFSNADSVKRLNAITHPALKEQVSEELRDYEQVVIDAALLFELHLNTVCDLCWFVDAPRELRQSRLGVDKQNFLKREQYQEPYDIKRSKCQSILINDGRPEILHKKILALLEEIK